MAGPGLEIFKFGLYLVVPIGLMIHYSKPEWYTKNVDPVSNLTASVKFPHRLNFSQYRARLFPPLEKTNQVRNEIGWWRVSVLILIAENSGGSSHIA